MTRKKPGQISRNSCFENDLSLARATGLEPATTGSTVRYSNQLSYAPVAKKKISFRGAFGKRPEKIREVAAP